MAIGRAWVARVIGFREKFGTVPIGLVGKEMQTLKAYLQPFSGFRRTIGWTGAVLWLEKKCKSGCLAG
jgi:hypothetical protein